MSASEKVAELLSMKDREKAVVKLWDLAEKLADLLDRVRWEGDWTYSCRREYSKLTGERMNETES